MIDFNNLTEKQKEFFSNMWESHQQQAEQTTESVKGLNAYLEKSRKQEEEQAKAAEVLKTRLV